MKIKPGNTYTITGYTELLNGKRVMVIEELKPYWKAEMLEDSIVFKEGAQVFFRADELTPFSNKKLEDLM